MKWMDNNELLINCCESLVVGLLPLDIGDSMCIITLAEPALYPIMVTLPGLPLNAAMFCFTQRNTAT